MWKLYHGGAENWNSYVIVCMKQEETCDNVHQYFTPQKNLYLSYYMIL